MSTLLWMISFLLHGISILAIYLLVKNTRKASDQSVLSKQTETILKETLEEIRKENKTLQDLLVDKQKKTDKKKPAKEKTGVNITEPPETINESSWLMPDDNKLQKNAVETSLEAKILQLHANGEAVEAIARKLNCGKTEAEIIIKLHQAKRKNF